MTDSVTLANWMDPPHNRWAFHHVAELINTVQISNNQGSVTRLANRKADLNNVSFIARDGSTTTWDRHLNETY
ncbi:MAG: hypothetical protein RLZZ51_73, partial [Actinomycetota bacterium]